MFDASGDVTDDSALATTYTHTVKMHKVIDGFSTEALMATKISTASTIVIVAPKLGGI
jgi:3-deoxy-D-manno-octulosonate 8-phosphate phosphatase KdsC-like HAD superfamily phosphatase